MAEGKGTRILLGIAVAVLVAVVGFSLYQAVTGNSSINQVIVFIFLGIMAYGLINAGLFAREKTLDAENFILIVLMIGVPIAMIFLLKSFGFDLFSAVSIGGTASVNIELTGSVMEWIKNNLGLFSIGLILLIAFRERIAKGIR